MQFNLHESFVTKIFVGACKVGDACICAFEWLPPDIATLVLLMVVVLLTITLPKKTKLTLY